MDTWPVRARPTKSEPSRTKSKVMAWIGNNDSIPFSFNFSLNGSDILNLETALGSSFFSSFSSASITKGCSSDLAFFFFFFFLWSSSLEDSGSTSSEPVSSSASLVAAIASISEALRFFAFFWSFPETPSWSGSGVLGSERSLEALFFSAMIGDWFLAFLALSFLFSWRVVSVTERETEGMVMAAEGERVRERERFSPAWMGLWLWGAEAGEERGVSGERGFRVYGFRDGNILIHFPTSKPNSLFLFFFSFFIFFFFVSPPCGHLKHQNLILFFFY